MAAPRKGTARKRTTGRKTPRKSSSSRRGGGNKAVDRAGASLEASAKALRDLRTELQRGGSKLLRDADLRDIEKTLKSAGTSFRRISRRLLKDLEDVQKAATTGKTPRRGSGTKRKSTTKRTSSSTARRTSATKRASSSAKGGAKRARAAAKGARSGARRAAGGAKKGR
jgi:hypothetical protein